MPRERPTLASYKYVVPMTTRWADNDVYGHVNNVAYYALFDSAANRLLIEEGGLDIARGPVIGLVVESHCSYHAPLAYPASLRVGVRVDKLGETSVTYGIGVFGEREETAAANGHFVHVFVDRITRVKAPIPPNIRAALSRYAVG